MFCTRVCLGHALVRDAERLLHIAPTLHWARQKKARQYSSLKTIMDVAGNAHALLAEVDGWRKMPLPVGIAS